MTDRMGRPSRGRARRVLTFAGSALLALCLPGAASAQWATSGSNIGNTNTGNVGIGTITPQEKLHVDGRVRSEYDFLAVGRGGIQVWKDASATRAVNLSMAVPGQPLTDNLQLSTHVSGVGWTGRMTILSSNGNVGIGTNAPGKKLEVLAPDGEAARLYRNGNGLNWGVNVKFALNNSANSLVDYAGLHGQISNPAAGSEGGNLLFTTATDGQLTEKMRLDATGNLGVGTAAPAAKLHVAGDIRVDGNINAKYQDVAEWVRSAQQLAAGTVVVLDPERSNQVLASASAYDTSVAGVVSAQPGIALGEKGEGKVLVATTGRVKVRVDATRAPIKIGDLLVTSDVAGVAMRSEPAVVGGRRMHAPGTIIGKALEPLAAGAGEILVLLSLQ